MLFNETCGTEEINGAKVFTRRAVRAIIFENDKILLIKTNLGDYKLPGGGVKSNENHEETLIREVEEESGYTIKKVSEKIGEIIERNPDKFEKDAVFEMTSYYYLCEISEGRKEQQLDDYEKELDFKIQWISLEEAIKRNELVLNSSKENINNWVLRETKVLKILKEWRGY